MLKRLRRLAAYLVVRILLKTAQVLPRTIGSAVFGMLGAVAYLCLAKSRKIAWANLRLVYGRGTPDKEIRGIAAATFVNLAKFAFDVARLKGQTPEGIKSLVKVTGRHHLDKALAKGKGVIALTGHVGNWELLGAYFSLMGYPVNVLATRLRDSRLNDQLVSLRDTVGLKVIERSRGLKQAFRCLRRGEVLGVLIDQDTSVDSVIVDFLGQPAKTAVGPVKLAARTGASIVPLAMLLMDDGSYHIKVREPLHIGGHSDALKCDVEECSKAIEGFIYEKPSQWVWMHRRWKSVRSDIYR